ncbi:outer membrane beta-barrel family protein [Polaribacter cellanae]|uniref:TonB-dependent receptor n=1 Tax=Polaribacter cellanae TaxID=2818493 RepID=A0A975CMA4_9FLAO|nr:outer membrane beta-barrel family protein [Polaribacter cellanae]QTE21835.1 TonB-dependent receptor [Polaribacter cellanae]
MKLVYFLISLSLANIVSAQTINYGGVVENNDSKEDLLIILSNIKDSTLVYSQNTTNNTFLIKNVETGNYERCVISNLYNQCDTIILNQSIENDIIYLENSYQLGEVVITAKKPLIQNKNGVLKVNVENSPIMSSGTLFETLSKLPGVSYNQANGSFKLKGKDGIQIQMDGQTVYISGNELSSLLKSIPAEDVSNIEINSSPSAKYDAGGSGGIININTKKIKRQGIYIGTSLNATQGKYYKQNFGLKSQFNTKKQRFMLYYINSFNTDFENADTERQFTENYTTQNTYAKIKGNSNTLNAQYENQFSKSNLLLNSSISLYKEDINQNTNLDLFDNSHVLYSNVYSNQQSNNKLKNFDFGANYKMNFKKSDITLKSNYVYYNIDNSSYLISTETPQVNTFNNLQNISPNKVNLLVSQLDYNQVIDSLSHFETGLKYIYQDIDNENNFYQNINNSLTFDSDKSNGYLYREQIVAGYFQYYKTINKFDFTLGGRLEYNPSKGFDKKNEYTLKREQTNFFPFINIAFNYSDNNNFNLSYTKRINRPRFSNLMPFTYYVDPYTQLIGNPNLKSSITNQVELQFIHKRNYIFSIAYSLINNSIYQTPIQNNATLNTILTPLNIDKTHSLSLNANLSFDLTKWWYFNINAIGFYDKISSSNDAINIASDNFSGQIVTTNSFSLPKNIQFEITTDYVSPFIQGPYKTDDLFSMNASLSKSFFDNKMRVSIIGNDILRTYKINNNSIIVNQISNIFQRFDTHWIRLSLVYRFNKGIKKGSATDDKTTEELKSRVK